MKRKNENRCHIREGTQNAPSFFVSIRAPFQIFAETARKHRRPFFFLPRHILKKSDSIRKATFYCRPRLHPSNIFYMTACVEQSLLPAPKIPLSSQPLNISLIHQRFPPPMPHPFPPLSPTATLPPGPRFALHPHL